MWILNKQNIVFAMGVDYSVKWRLVGFLKETT
jgi:hypothetical protein